MRRSLARAAWRIGLAATAAMWVAWATPSLAQTMPGGSVPSGPLTGTPSIGGKLFELDVVGKILYDSNVSGGQSVVADVKALHKDDIIYTPSTTVNFSLPVGREFVFLTGNVGYDFHQYNSLLDHQRITLTGGVGGQLGRCALELTDSYAVSQTQQSDLPLNITKNIQTTQSVAGQATCSTGSGLGEFLSVRHTATDNSGSSEDTATAIGVVNSHTSTVSGGLSYQNPTLGAATIFASYATNDYSNSAPNALPTPSYKIYSGGLSYARPIGTRLKGSVEVSIQSVKPSDAAPITLSNGAVLPPTRGFTSFSTSGSLDYRLNSRIGASLEFQRGAQPTIQQGSSVTIVEFVDGTIHYSPSSRLSTSLGASYRHVDYRADSAAVAQTLNLVTSDDMTAYFASLGFHIGRKGMLLLDARRQIRNTNLTIFNYTEYRVGLTATAAF